MAASPRPLLLVPLGSCEQHGPHLPLDTDTRIAEHTAHAAASRLPATTVAPALAITASGEHAGFPGTLSIGTAALTTVLIELVRSADWAGGVVLVNGHGGNRDAVVATLDTLRAEGRAVWAWWPSIPGADAHAGRTETALMLHLDPAAVDRTTLAPGVTTPLRELAARLRHEGVHAVSPSGVLGDPTGATADEGRRLADALVDDLVDAVTDWSR